jgi:hypothetical protein
MDIRSGLIYGLQNIEIDLFGEGEGIHTKDNERDKSGQNRQQFFDPLWNGTNLPQAQETVHLRTQRDA